MNIDFLGGMPPPQTIDIKIEKDTERVATRPVEESGKGNNLRFNIDKEAALEKEDVKNGLKNVEADADTYNERGNLSPKRIYTGDPDDQQEPLHFIV